MPKPKPKPPKPESEGRARAVLNLLNAGEVANLLGHKRRLTQKDLIVWRHAAQALRGNLESLRVLLRLADQEPDNHHSTKRPIEISYEDVNSSDLSASESNRESVDLEDDNASIDCRT